VRESQDKDAGASGRISAEQSVEAAVKDVFTIGLNCDADALFNKDPKDANKYEIEGVKTQNTTQ
jgi:hypothetical protein